MRDIKELWQDLYAEIELLRKKIERASKQFDDMLKETNERIYKKLTDLLKELKEDGKRKD